MPIPFSETMNKRNASCILNDLRTWRVRQLGRELRKLPDDCKLKPFLQEEVAKNIKLRKRLAKSPICEATEKDGTVEVTALRKGMVLKMKVTAGNPSSLNVLKISQLEMLTTMNIMANMRGGINGLIMGKKFERHPSVTLPKVFDGLLDALMETLGISGPYNYRYS